MRAHLVVLAALLLVPVAAAQFPVPVCPTPSVAFDPERLDLAPGASGEFEVTATNPGQIPVSITVEYTAPPGFAVDPPTSENGNVPAGQFVTNTVRITALANAPVGTTRQVTAEATATCGTGPAAQQSAAASATADLVVVPAAPSPGEGLLGAATQPAVLAIGGLALVLLVGAVALKSRREGFGVACPEAEKMLRPGRGTSFPLEVQNRSGAPDTAQFTVSDVPDGWTAFTALPEIQLGPRETRTLWLMVRAPATAPEGTEAVLRVTATSRAHPTKSNGVTVKAAVKDEAPANEPQG